MRGPRGDTVAGEVIEVATDSVTIALEESGSVTVYTDSETVVAYATGADELKVGAQVVAVTEPQAEGVMTATYLIVQ